MFLSESKNLHVSNPMSHTLIMLHPCEIREKKLPLSTLSASQVSLRFPVLCSSCSIFAHMN